MRDAVGFVGDDVVVAGVGDEPDDPLVVADPFPRHGIETGGAANASEVAAEAVCVPGPVSASANALWLNSAVASSRVSNTARVFMRFS